MKILNETVYASDDLEKVIVFARDKAHQNEMRAWITRPLAIGPKPNPHALPAQVRFGYFNMVPVEKRTPNKRGHINTEVSYVSRTGRCWRGNGVLRVGIVRPTDLPLAAMEVIARAAADREDRTLPSAVMENLVVALIRSLFNGYCCAPNGEEEKQSDGCPEVHYDHRPDRESAEASKSLARVERESRVSRRLGYCLGRIESLKTSLAEEQEKLVKLQAQVDKIQSRKKGVARAG